MGGSILGTAAIFNFLRIKVKKNIEFINNLETIKIFRAKNNKSLNLIVSK